MIIFLIRRFYPLIGGVETHVLEITKQLQEQGYEVLVITEKMRQYDSKEIDIDIPEEIDGIRIIRIKAGSDNWFKKFRVWSEIWKLRSTISQADIVHCHDVFFWYLPFRFVYPFKKVYTTFHGYETKFPIIKKAIIIRKISELMSNGNICVGEYIKKWYGTKPNFVIYGGVNQIKNQRSKIKHINQESKIVLLGRLEKDIGIQVYANALEKLKKDRVNFKFEAFGDGLMKNKLEKYGRVNGFVNDINNLLREADIIFASSYLIMLQALAFKKIVIAVYENPIKEDYLKLSPFANSIYICKNADEIVRVVESVKNNPWKSKTMIENGYKWANGQTWNKVTDIYLKLWKL